MQNTQEQKYKTMTEAPVKGLIVKLAIPTMISMLVTSFYNMADTFFVGKLGPSATGAVGVVFSVMAIIQAVGFFFGHGSGNYISRALGAHDVSGAESMAATGFFSALIGGTVIMIGGLLFLEPLALALGSSETILPYAVDYLRWILIGAPYMTASLVLNNQLRFQGNAIYAMIGLVSGAVINIALDPLLIFTFDLGVSGAAIATIVSQLVSFVILLIGIFRSNAIDIRIRNFKPTVERYKIIINGGASGARGGVLRVRAGDRFAVSGRSGRNRGGQNRAAIAVHYIPARRLDRNEQYDEPDDRQGDSGVVPRDGAAGAVLHSRGADSAAFLRHSRRGAFAGGRRRDHDRGRDSAAIKDNEGNEIMRAGSKFSHRLIEAVFRGFFFCRFLLIRNFQRKKKRRAQNSARSNERRRNQ